MRLAPLSLFALLAPLLVVVKSETHGKRRLPSFQNLERSRAEIVGRQGPPGRSSSPAEQTSTPPPTTTSSSTTSSTSTTSSSSSSPTPTSSSSSSSSTTPTSTSTQPPSSSSSSQPPATSSTFSSTGVPVVTVTSTNTPSETVSSTTSSTSPTSTGASGGGGSGGPSTGAIIGLSVAAGIGVLGIVGFIVWKLKKKRFADFDDDDGNAIRWPELDGASAMHPLPARPTGRSGIETSALDRSEDAFDGRSMANSSTADLAAHAAPGPYSTPAADPQQYYDDPARVDGGYGAQPGAGPYYDPYTGSVPASLTPHLEQDPYGGTTTDPYGRTGSPGPNAAYDTTQRVEMQHVGGYDAFGGAAPGGGGRTPSPGPHAAYGGGRTSPGPQVAYGGGRSGSPGPEAAYGAGRTGSPGPQVAYGGAHTVLAGPESTDGGYRS